MWWFALFYCLRAERPTRPYQSNPSYKCTTSRSCCENNRFSPFRGNAAFQCLLKMYVTHALFPHVFRQYFRHPGILSDGCSFCVLCLSTHNARLRGAARGQIRPRKINRTRRPRKRGVTPRPWIVLSRNIAFSSAFQLGYHERSQHTSVCSASVGYFRWKIEAPQIPG